jgi:Ser/Thr protein kinase RdoA (MazF antagonist)
MEALNDNESRLLAVAEKFDIGSPSDVAPLGEGLINDTYKVTTSEGGIYVLQRINHNIFRDVDLMQRNIAIVTGRIRERLEGDPDIERKVLTFVPVKETGKTWLYDGGSYWRVSVFISDSFTCSNVDERTSYLAGKAFGAFEADLADLAPQLGETIPDFHNMGLRLRQLKEAVEADPAGRMSDPKVSDLVRKALAVGDDMCILEKLHAEGKLPKRVCHCDTKINNMLFGPDGEVLCVIDLDTTMPSFVSSDFGDFLRIAANTAAEDEPDTSKVSFRMDVFRSFAKGYLESAKVFLTPTEIGILPFSATLFPYMQAVRFLTDHISGDTYYKIAYPGHNLTRAVSQWALFENAEEHLGEMHEYISGLTKE